MIPNLSGSDIRARLLRASTKEQDALRAKEELRRFAKERGLRIAAYYIENESGASLKRPELFRLLEDSDPSDDVLELDHRGGKRFGQEA
jgi:DNA invertase Pin-like site-specific DNA recombinase